MMAVRNFWVDVDIDGRKTRLSGGPQRKDGGMTIYIKVREEGCIKRGLAIYCTSDGEVNQICIHGRDGLLRQPMKYKR